MANAPQCRKCGCEISHRERSEGSGLCWICARNQRDRDDARRAD